MSETPKVWIGTLGLYNAGHLIGAWFDAADCPTDVEEWSAHESVAAQLAEFLAQEASYDLREDIGEEVWCFDHEGFDGLLTEECSPSTAKELAEVLETVAEPSAFAAFVANIGRNYAAQNWDATREQFEDAYQGHYDSEEHFAMQLAEDLGYDDNEVHTNWPFTCIDWEKAWRELEIGGDYWSSCAPQDNGSPGHGGFGYYVFRSM